jgi:hypothetical protein
MDDRSKQTEPMTLAERALMAYEGRHREREQKRDAMWREREEREARDATARDEVCRQVLGERFYDWTLSWDLVDSGGDPNMQCWAVYTPGDGSSDIEVAVKATYRPESGEEVEGYDGLVAMAERLGVRVTYGTRIHSLADLGQAIHDRDEATNRGV